MRDNSVSIPSKIHRERNVLQTARSRQFRGQFTNDMDFFYTGMGSMREQFSPKIHREHVQKLREYAELLSFSSTHHSHAVYPIEERSVGVFI